jgi:hypothetical protein
VTLVNVFTVEPEHQQELLDVLIEATEQVMSKLPAARRGRMPWRRQEQPIAAAYRSAHAARAGLCLRN